MCTFSGVPNVITSIEALKRLSSFPLEAMMQEIGPLALVQRATEFNESPAMLYKQFTRTVDTEGKMPVARHTLSLLLGLEKGVVVALARDNPEGEMILGRGVEADVQLQDASVSAKHAAIRWDAWQRTAWLRDLGSTNGTLVNGHKIDGEVELVESNIVTLGTDTAFLFLKTETLYAMVHSR